LGAGINAVRASSKRSLPRGGSNWYLCGPQTSLIPKAEWDDQPPWLQNAPQRWYGEINSVGPDAASVVLRDLVNLIEQK
jgi:hypothetical protein